METGKEIYLEYIAKQLHEERAFKYYLYKDEPLDNIDEWLNGIFVPVNFGRFTRAPKTQMINGHEVIAPMHDMPKSEDYCYWLDFSADSGVCSYDAGSLSESEKQSLSINGWFDNKENAIAYAKAHRESK